MVSKRGDHHHASMRMPSPRSWTPPRRLQSRRQGDEKRDEHQHRLEADSRRRRLEWPDALSDQAAIRVALSEPKLAGQRSARSAPPSMERPIRLNTSRITFIDIKAIASGVWARSFEMG